MTSRPPPGGRARRRRPRPRASSTSPTPPPSRPPRRRAPGRGRQLRRVDRRRRRGVRGGRRHRVNGEGAGTSPPPRGGGRVRRARLHGLRLRRPGARAVHRVRPTGAARAYGRSKLAGEPPSRPPRPARTRSSAPSWLFGAHGGNFVATMLRLARERDEVTVVDDQVGCPTFTGHLAAGARRDRRAAPRRLLPRRRRGGVLVVRPRARGLRGDRRRRRVPRGRTADLGRPAPRPAYSVLRTERPTRPPPAVARGPGRLPRPEGHAHEAARVRRRRLHRLELRAPARARARRRGHGPRQAHLRRPAREPRRPADAAASASCTAGSRTPPPSPTRSRAPTRS